MCRCKGGNPTRCSPAQKPTKAQITKAPRKPLLPAINRRTLHKHKGSKGAYPQISLLSGTKAGATPWFLSTDAACEPALVRANKLGYTAVQIGHISTSKGSDFLRALRRCVDKGTGDRTRYALNSVACQAGGAVERILGYVR